jgi:hypothetical protein
MENTVRLSDQELIEIAWEAVRSSFELSDYENATIEIYHQLVTYPLSDLDAPAIEQVWIWLNHPEGSSLKDARATGRANSEISSRAEAKGDERFFSLFHGFSETRFKRASAA